MSKKKQSYTKGGLTVTFDPNICIHSAVCVKGLPGLFDVSKKRWVRLENGSPDEVAEVVGRCPSGALQVESGLGETGETG